MATDDHNDYVALTQKLLAEIVRHGDDGAERGEQMVGGFVDPATATDALVYCLAAVNLHTTECSTPKGQRETADGVRFKFRQAMKHMIENDASPFASVTKMPNKAN